MTAGSILGKASMRMPIGPLTSELGFGGFGGADSSDLGAAAGAGADTDG